MLLLAIVRIIERDYTMNEILWRIGRAFAFTLFMLVGSALMIWSANLTMHFTAILFPDRWEMPLLSLTIFDAGTLAWLLVFVFSVAKGLTQRALCLVMTFFNLAGTIATSVGDVYMGGQELVGVPVVLAETMIWVYIVWSSVNIIAGIIHFLASPEVIEAIMKQTAHDMMMLEAYKEFLAKVKDTAVPLGKRLGKELYTDATKSFAALPEDGDEKSELLARLKTLEKENIILKAKRVLSGTVPTPEELPKAAPSRQKQSVEAVETDSQTK